MRYLENENPYIWSRFTTGDTVTITIYKASDDSVIVNAVAMSELSTTGYFKYQFNPSPTELTEYFYITTNSIEEHAGKIILGGYPDGIKDETDKIQTIDDNVDRILKATEVKQCTITDASATSSSFTTNLTETSNQFWKRGVILITSGANEGQIRAIENYNGSTKAVTIKTPLDSAPAQNDTFIILTERKYLTPDIEDIIGAVWDEPMADHLTDGSTGYVLDFLKNIEGGKWHITGNQMIFTKADNVTEICRFNLFNSADNPAEINIYKRERV